MIFNGVSVDIDLVADKLQLEYKIVSGGRELNVACPFDTHTSGQYKVYVNRSSGQWVCKACSGKRGGLVRLVSSVLGISISEAIEWIIEGGSEIDHAAYGEYILDILKARKQKSVLQSDIREGIDPGDLTFMEVRYKPWMTQRGIDRETVDSWHLGYASKSTYPWIFPVVVGSKVKYFIRRSKKKKPSKHRPKYLYSTNYPRNEILYGLDHFEGDFLVLTEGPIDCLKIWQALRKHKMLDRYGAVAIGGSSLSSEQAESIVTVCDKVLMFYDNDSGGIEEAEPSTVQKLGKRVTIRCVDHALSPLKDAGEMDDKTIVDLIKNAVPLYVNSVRSRNG